MQNEGWIKLHRQILDNPKLNSDNDYWVVWIKLLLLVTHKEKRAIFKGKDIILKPGQIITGRKFLSKFCGVERSKLERILKYLESEQQIEQQTTNQNRLITVKKWTFYQQGEQQNEQQVSNKRATSEQRVSTYKNDKNVKNDNKYRFFKNEKFKKTWDDFLIMRKKIKKPATDRAQELILNTLHKEKYVEIALQMLENSIVGGWQGVFPLKPDERNGILNQVLPKYEPKMDIPEVSDEQRKKNVAALKKIKDNLANKMNV